MMQKNKEALLGIFGNPRNSRKTHLFTFSIYRWIRGIFPKMWLEEFEAAMPVDIQGRSPKSNIDIQKSYIERRYILKTHHFWYPCQFYWDVVVNKLVCFTYLWDENSLLIQGLYSSIHLISTSRTSQQCSKYLLRISSQSTPKHLMRLGLLGLPKTYAYNKQQLFGGFCISRAFMEVSHCIFPHTPKQPWKPVPLDFPVFTMARPLDPQHGNLVHSWFSVRFSFFWSRGSRK